MSARRAAILMLGLALAAAGCASGGPKEDPLLALSAEEALTIGRELMEAGKYGRAQEHFTHAFEVEPNSASGREGLLLAADALFLDGGTDNYIKAEAKYRDFQNRFPTSDKAAYVQFQRASCLAKRMLKPDRDQSVTRQALAAYQEILQIYPDSEYASESREQIQIVRENLAEHELGVALFNYSFRLYPAAISRLRTILEDYPEYRGTDRVLYHLGLALLKAERAEEAEEAFARLRSDYPESQYLAKLSKKGAA